jgi:hypothetical protein
MKTRFEHGPNEHSAEQGVWDLHRKFLLARGIDPRKWAEKQASKFESLDARTGLIGLVNNRCTPEVLAAIFALHRYSHLLERIWNEMVGNPNKRQRVSRAVEKAASMIEDVFRDVIAGEDDSMRAHYADVGRIPLSRILSELRFYHGFLNLAKGLRTDTETRSLQEFAKYLLSGYIKRASGRFHDREVSALLAELIGPPLFDEVAQRMWRLRNYKRLEKHFSKVADFLFAMGVVINRRA